MRYKLLFDCHIQYFHRDPKKGEHTLTKVFNSLKESKYFQRLAMTSIVKNAMDKVSNTPLKLYVELKYLSGAMCVNIAPPPTDRIWYVFILSAFRCNIAGLLDFHL